MCRRGDGGGLPSGRRRLKFKCKHARALEYVIHACAGEWEVGRGLGWRKEERLRLSSVYGNAGERENKQARAMRVSSGGRCRGGGAYMVISNALD